MHQQETLLPGTYEAITSLRLGLFHGSNLQDISDLYQPGETFEILRSANGFRRAVIWWTNDPLGAPDEPKPQWRRVKPQAC